MKRSMAASVMVAILAVASMAMAGDRGAERDSLTLWGSRHVATGGAALVSGADQIVVQADSASDKNGVRIHFGEPLVKGFGPVLSMTRDLARDGAELVAIVYGPREGKAGQRRLADLAIRESNGSLEVAPRFKGIGAESYQAQILLDGVVVKTISGLRGQPFEVDGMVDLKAADSGTHLCFFGSGIISIKGKTASIGLPRGKKVRGNEIVFAAENPSRRGDLVTDLQFALAGISNLKITSEHFHFAEHAH